MNLSLISSHKCHHETSVDLSRPIIKRGYRLIFSVIQIFIHLMVDELYYFNDNN